MGDAVVSSGSSFTNYAATMRAIRFGDGVLEITSHSLGAASRSRSETRR